MSARIVFRRFGKIVATAFIVMLISIVVAITVTKFFSIQVIEIQGTGVGVIVDQKNLSKNLIFFPTEQVQNQLMNENPLLVDVQIRKKLPHTLIIIPKLRTPIARLQTNARTVDIDKEGMVISDSMPGESLPTLVFDILPIRIGQKIRDPQVVSGLDAVTRMGALLPIDSITELGSASLQIKSGSLRIYFTQHENLSDVSSTLQTLLSGFRIKGTLPAVIDLRFAKPVISF